MSCLLIDISGVELNDEDCSLIAHPLVAGLILFSRNFVHVEQLKTLIHSIKELKPQAMIAVDQEGGPVQRFREGFTKLPASSYWGELYKNDKMNTIQEIKNFTSTQAKELIAVGVNLPLTPVLDLDWGRNSVTHERSYSSNPQVVIELGEIVIDRLHEYGLPVVGKHFPGHGAVEFDSHYVLPVDTRSWDEIVETDLKPFSHLTNCLDAIMPAHIIYSEMDRLPVGFSSFWLQEVLRNKLNFKGLIVSDDINMKAADQYGDFLQRVELALQAGCDLVSICNNRAGTVSVIDQLNIERFSQNKRTEQFIQ